MRATLEGSLCCPNSDDLIPQRPFATPRHSARQNPPMTSEAFSDRREILNGEEFVLFFPLHLQKHQKCLDSRSLVQKKATVLNCPALAGWWMSVAVLASHRGADLSDFLRAA
eukprot:TRINITY_DN8052_c0_g1_i2.p1 TRINITY_DN8052_c0_g1~~TRINITY_DN8052_c0_g1_i2.p1  ORF type:complete len:112 (-),score=11.10 TRINITY_DN8052_c0_g1_i2:285-620(-)